MATFRPNYLALTVVSARNLQSRPVRNGKNDAFVQVSLDGHKVQTGVKQNAAHPDWNEQWEFFLSKPHCLLRLTVHHRTFLGLDEFLGQLTLPLDELMDPTDMRPRNRWYPLRGRKNQTRYRGELELRLEFRYKPPGLAPNVVKMSNDSDTEVKGGRTSLRDRMSATLNRKDKDTARRPSLPSRSSNGSVPNLSLTLPSARLPPSKSMDLLRLSKANTPLRDGTPPVQLKQIIENKPLSPVQNQTFDFIDGKGGEKKETTAVIKVPHQADPTPHLYTKSTSCMSRDEDLRLRAKQQVAQGQWLPKEGVVALDLIMDTLTKEDLLDVIKEQRIRLGRQERKIRDLEDYIDKLITRVIDVKPDLLAAPLDPIQPPPIRF